MWMKLCGKKKTIDIFTYKQRILSIDMKIKVVQHVKREWMRDWKRERVCLKLGEWLLNIDMKQAQAQGACRNDINRAQFHTISISGISAQVRAEADNDLRKSHDMLRKCTDRAEIPHHWRRNSRTIYCGMRTVCCGLVFNCWLYGCRFDFKKPDHVSCLYIHYAFTS